MKPIDAYRDSYGLLVQNDLDGGDSLWRASAFMVAKYVLKQKSEAFSEFKLFIPKYMIRPNVWVRHPDPSKWYSSPHNLSRDQYIQLQNAMAVIDNSKYSWSLLKALLKNFGLHPNIFKNGDDPKYADTKFPDIINPAQFGIAIRGIRCSFLYPLLYLLDIGLVLDTLLTNKDTWDRAANHVSSLAVAKTVWPTVWSLLACKLLDKEKAKTNIRRYFSLEKNGIPPLGELQCRVIDEVL